MEKITSLANKFLIAVDTRDKLPHYYTSGEIQAVLKENPGLGSMVHITELTKEAQRLTEAPETTHVIVFDSKEARTKFHKHLMNRFIDRRMTGPNMPRTYSYPE